MKHSDDLFHDALGAPEPAIGYRVSRYLAAAYPERAILEGEGCEFDPEAFAAGGQCRAIPASTPHARILTAWEGIEDGLTRRAQNAWFSITWERHALDVLVMTWGHGFQKTRGYWVLAQTM